MRAAEKALLLACRARLCSPLDGGGAGYSEDECNVEPDEQSPATVGQIYVAVIPGGWVYGPTHSTSGGVRDIIYGVNVAVIRRIGNVPRDRRRDVFINNLDALDVDVDKVFEAIDWKYEVINAANSIILAEAGSQEGFIHPLYGAGQVSKPQWCPAEMFAASGTDKAGLMRIIPFHGARRITTIA